MLKILGETLVKDRTFTKSPAIFSYILPMEGGNSLETWPTPASQVSKVSIASTEYKLICRAS